MKLISIIGCGNVGQTIAKEFLDLATPFVLNIIDPDPASAGTVQDLRHATSMDKKVIIHFNDFKLLNQSNYIIIAAAKSATTIGDRLKKAEQHIEMIYDIFKNFKATRNPFITVISNPVDVITYHTWKASKLKKSQIIGTGTYLETLRYQYYLSQFFEVPLTHIEGYLLGEHGNSAVPILSQTKINDLKVSDREKALDAANTAIKAPYEIRKKGKYTKFAISKCALRIFKALEHKENLHLPAGLILNEVNQALLSCSNICLSIPVSIIDGKIIQHDLSNLEKIELEQLKASAKILEAHI